MIPSTILLRYARSLADVVMENQEDSSVTRDLMTYRSVFQSVPNLLDAFHSPAVPRERKEEILTQLMDLYPVCRTAANFLRVLLQHNRMRYFHEIFDLYVQVVNERKGIIAAEVIAAHALSEAELARLREVLARVSGRAVSLKVSTDGDLLGGIVVQMGSTVFDGSIRQQLEELKERLKST